MKKNKGITLIAVIITIIILIIIAGITIISIIGKDGLLTHSKQAQQEQSEAEIKEKLILALQDLQVEKLGTAKISDVTQQWIDEKINDCECVVKNQENKKEITLKKDNKEETYIIEENLNVEQKIDEISNDDCLAPELILSGDDNFNDESENNVTVENNNSVEINKDDYIEGNGAFETNGNNNLSFDPSRYIFGKRKFKIDFWVKSFDIINYAGLIGQYSRDTKGSWQLKTDNNGYLMFTTYGIVSREWNDQISNVKIIDGKWHHILIFRDTNKIYIYIDNNLDKTIDIPETVTFGSDTQDRISIGKCIRDNSNFKGLMDEMRIYMSNF